MLITSICCAYNIFHEFSKVFYGCQPDIAENFTTNKNNKKRSDRLHCLSDLFLMIVYDCFFYYSLNILFAEYLTGCHALEHLHQFLVRA